VGAVVCGEQIELATTGKEAVLGARFLRRCRADLTRMTMMAWEEAATWGAFVKAFPLTAMLIVSWAIGEFMGEVNL